MTQKQLAQLNSLRENWLGEFKINDVNSVAAQLCRLTWSVTAFEIFQEMVRLSPDAEERGKQVNGLIFESYARNFFDSFMSSVRKITDKSKGTRSLRKLVEDMLKHSSLFTRDLMLASEGVEYDSSELEKKEQEWLEEEFKKGVKVAVGNPYHLSAFHSRCLGSQFKWNRRG